MTIVRDQIFEDEVVKLDGTEFVGCSFTNCVLEYHGGEFGFKHTSFSECHHVFYGPALNVLQFLTGAGFIKPGPIKRGAFAQTFQ